MRMRAPVRSISRPTRGAEIAPTANITVMPLKTISLGMPSESSMWRPSTEGIRKVVPQPTI